jgi:hypothetical protein
VSEENDGPSAHIASTRTIAGLRAVGAPRSSWRLIGGPDIACRTLKTEQSKTETKPAQKQIGGKLGIIVKSIGPPKGATLEQLENKTGWQPHTVRAALSRLRKRGLVITLGDVDGRRAYRGTSVRA